MSHCVVRNMAERSGLAVWNGNNYGIPLTAEQCGKNIATSGDDV